MVEDEEFKELDSDKQKKILDELAKSNSVVTTIETQPSFEANDFPIVHSEHNSLPYSAPNSRPSSDNGNEISFRNSYEDNESAIEMK